MCAVTVAMRAVSVSFNVYLSSALTPSGMGLFALITSVYGFAVTVAASGVNLAATRLSAQYAGGGNIGGVRSAIGKCAVYSLLFGCAACVGLLFGAPLVGNYLLRDARTVLSLRILALGLPFIAVSNVVTGYFAAIGRVWKNAVTQVFEQLLQITLTVSLVTLLSPRGLEYACAGVSLGISAGAVSSCVCLALQYAADVKIHKLRRESSNTRFTDVASIAFPIAASSYVRSGLLSVEHMLIPRGLRIYGAAKSSPDTSLASYGTLHGMVFPVIMFPQAFLLPFLSLLIPELSSIAASQTKNGAPEALDLPIIRDSTARALRFAMCFSVGVSSVMLCFSGPLGMLLYSSGEASEYIRLLAPLISVMYLDSTVDAALKGLGQQIYVMRVNIADSLICVAAVWLAVPRFGIRGYIAILILSEIINTALSLMKLLEITGIRIDVFRCVFLPVICASGASSMLRVILALAGASSSVYGVFGLAAAILFTSIAYLLLLRLTGTFTAKDTRWIKAVIASK